jgi:hypothetical protein
MPSIIPSYFSKNYLYYCNSTENHKFIATDASYKAYFLVFQKVEDSALPDGISSFVDLSSNISLVETVRCILNYADYYSKVDAIKLLNVNIEASSAFLLKPRLLLSSSESILTYRVDFSFILSTSETMESSIKTSMYNSFGNLTKHLNVSVIDGIFTYVFEGYCGNYFCVSTNSSFILIPSYAGPFLLSDGSSPSTIPTSSIQTQAKSGVLPISTITYIAVAAAIFAICVIFCASYLVLRRKKDSDGTGIREWMASKDSDKDINLLVNVTDDSKLGNPIGLNEIYKNDYDDAEDTINPGRDSLRQSTTSNKGIQGSIRHSLESYNIVSSPRVASFENETNL